jgi:DNA-binding NarL/FixJ family response regulator
MLVGMQFESEEQPRIARILIVDDHEIVREGLRSALSSDEALEVVGEAATGAEALQVARRTLPDVALVDLRLPDITGEELCRRLSERFPGTALIVLTTYLSEETVRGALQAGAVGYVTKASGLTELRAAIARAVAGDEAVASDGPQIVQRLHDVVAARMGETTLTPQQERVLELAAQGLTSTEIGERLFIAESTVRFHIQKLKAKLSARTKTELVAKAIRFGVIAPADEDVASQR